MARVAIVAACGLVAAPAALAHEFWVAPTDYAPEAPGPATASLKVGQMMKGTEIPYISDKVRHFTVTVGDVTRDGIGIDGDIPALSFRTSQPGLHVVAYVAAPERVTFDTFAEFADYLEYEGLSEIAAAHRARGLAETAIGEAYSRYAKSLLQVGPVRDDGTGDVALGLDLELVAERNPYAPDTIVLPVRLTWRGAPVGGRQVAVFRDNGETVSRTLATTDADGCAEIALDGEAGEYLLNAVHIEPSETDGVAWRSHWASLTFALPSSR